jgi:glycyl-tRNA synthetase beta chain
MAKHEKFFPVRDEAGKLTNRFVSIRNGGVEETVREGNEWVLNARFNDANFFFEEDKKHTLEHFLEKTIGIVFQDKLGTVRQRAHRLSELVGDVARATGANEQEIASATHAGLFAKADLSSGLVSELPALQGMIGAEYARRENFPDPVCWAIASHYDLSKNATVDCEGARTAVRLLMADQLDKLAGYLGIGLVPTGSSDPYGLRRAATMLIEAAIRWPTRFHGYAGLCHCARLAYGRQGFIDVQDCSAAFAEIMQSRYSNIFEGARHDLLEAAIGATPEHILDPQGVQFRLKVLQAVADDTQFIFTATRPLNIVDAAAKKGIEFETDEPLEKISNDSLESAEGAAVANLLRNTQDPARRAAHNRDVDILLAQLRQLQEPINTFFDTTMVMDENPSVRYARLSLMNAAAHQFRLAGEFSKIVIAGE